MGIFFLELAEKAIWVFHFKRGLTLHVQFVSRGQRCQFLKPLNGRDYNLDKNQNQSFFVILANYILDYVPPVCHLQIVFESCLGIKPDAGEKSSGEKCTIESNTGPLQIWNQQI